MQYQIAHTISAAHTTSRTKPIRLHVARNARSSAVSLTGLSLQKAKRKRLCKAQGNSAQTADPQASDATNSDDAQAAAQSRVVATLRDIEAAVQQGTLDPSDLEGLLPVAIEEVNDLVARAQAAETARLGAEEEAKSSQNRYLRLNADFDNYRKRSAAEKEQTGERIRGDVIKALVPLVDSFEAAQNSVKAETESEQSINAAYQGLYKQMVETFKSLGVEAVPGVGEPFDPEYHDAIMREPSEEVPDGTVLQEFRRGFRLGKTLLRPGMVKVSFQEAASPAPSVGEEASVIDVEEGSTNAEGSE